MDDPVRMYSVRWVVSNYCRVRAKFHCKTYEAGREMMIGGICESPPLFKSTNWRDQIADGVVPLVISLTLKLLLRS